MWDKFVFLFVVCSFAFSAASYADKGESAQGGLEFVPISPVPAPQIGMPKVPAQQEEVLPKKPAGYDERMWLNPNGNGEPEKSKTCGESCSDCCSFWFSPFKFNWQNTKNIAKFFCNPDYINPFKCTTRRVVGQGVLAAIGGGIGTAIWQKGLEVFRLWDGKTAGFIAMNGTGVILDTVAQIFSNPPPLDPTPPEKFARTALVMALHGKNKDISKALNSALNIGFKPEQIFIVENAGGRYWWDQGKPGKYIRDDPRFKNINYIYFSRLGNKVSAQYAGASSAYEIKDPVTGKRKFEYAVFIDDDVEFPWNWDPELNKIQGPSVGVSYPLYASNDDLNILTEMIDREYRDATIMKQFQDKLGSVFVPHGAIMTVRLENYLEIITQSPIGGQFLGEDARFGEATRNMGWEFRQGRMAVGTGSPETCDILCMQRDMSWDVGVPLLFGAYLSSIFGDCPKKFTLDELLLKFPMRKYAQIQPVITIFTNVAKPLLMVSYHSSLEFLITNLAIMEFNAMRGVIYDTVNKPRAEGRTAADGGEIFRSVVYNHLKSFVYSQKLAQAGCIGTVCGLAGAGAGDPKDYRSILPFPKAIQSINKVRGVEKRQYLMTEYIKTNSRGMEFLKNYTFRGKPNPNDPNGPPLLADDEGGMTQAMLDDWVFPPYQPTIGEKWKSCPQPEPEVQTVSKDGTPPSQPVMGGGDGMSQKKPAVAPAPEGESNQVAKEAPPQVVGAKEKSRKDEKRHGHGHSHRHPHSTAKEKERRQTEEVTRDKAS